jgi:hypothetical protein
MLEDTVRPVATPKDPYTAALDNLEYGTRRQRVKGTWKPLLMATLVATGTWFVAVHFATPWEGSISPNKADLSTFVRLGKFPSLEACRNTALTALEKLGALQRGTYECGQYCRPFAALPQPLRWHDGLAYRFDDEIHICQETTR